MGTIKKMSIKDYIDNGLELFGDDKKEWVYVCPKCGTEQTFHDFIKAGVHFNDIDMFLGFSCIGRWTKAGSSFEQNTDKKGCDWTLGGLLLIHKLEVEDDNGKIHMRFEFGHKKD